MKPAAARLSAVALAVAIGASACASSDTASTEPASEPAGTSTSMAMSEPAAQSDVVDTAVAAGGFTTLVAAVQAAGLEGTLRGPGPYTVFAPTDAAFQKLPAGTVQTLLANPTALAGILKYHVVAGKVTAADVAALDGQQVTTVNGAKLTVNVGADGSVTLTDATGNQVKVVKTDIETSNGVIHVVDSVLMPS